MLQDQRPSGTRTESRNRSDFNSNPVNRPIWQSGLSLFHNALSPKGSFCLACGKQMSKTAPGYSELCRSCYGAIPWIVRPKCNTCGRHVGCPDCTRQGIQGASPRSFVLNRSAVAYNATMREWLGQYKFRGHEAYGPILSRMMTRALVDMYREIAIRARASGQSYFQFDAITFVPTSDERLMERGFNQAEVLARSIAESAGIPIVPLLERTRHTDRHSFKNRRERLQDINELYGSLSDAEESFYLTVVNSNSKSIWSRISNVHKHIGMRGLSGLNTLNALNALNADLIPQAKMDAPLRILLIDDVFTTGSTIDACSSVLMGVCARLGRNGEIYSLTWARS